MKILIGDEVECIHTAFNGTALSKLEFFNKCIQFEVVPKTGKDGKMPEGQFIDVQSLKVIKKGPRHFEDGKELEEPTGGLNHKHIKMRGY